MVPFEIDRELKLAAFCRILLLGGLRSVLVICARCNLTCVPSLSFISKWIHAC